jgi:hypothetical protein
VDRDDYIECAAGLDRKGLVWCPEIGDEVVERPKLERVSILVDPHGLTPMELRQFFLWLPTVEQLVAQFEARQALIYHAGINSNFCYEAVIKSVHGIIESSAGNLRLALGRALIELLSDGGTKEVLH